VVFVLALFSAACLLAQPGPGGTNSNPWLDSWSFADTNYWTSDLGYYPISFTNLSVSTNGPGNSLLIDSTNESQLLFDTWNSDGTTNFNLAGEGSLMFWFNPDWTSGNGSGSGPGGDWSALIEIFGNKLGEGVSFHVQIPYANSFGWFLKQNTYMNGTNVIPAFLDPASSAVHLSQ